MPKIIQSSISDINKSYEKMIADRNYNNMLEMQAMDRYKQLAEKKDLQNYKKMFNTPDLDDDAEFINENQMIKHYSKTNPFKTETQLLNYSIATPTLNKILTEEDIIKSLTPAELEGITTQKKKLIN